MLGCRFGWNGFKPCVFSLFLPAKVVRACVPVYVLLNVLTAAHSGTAECDGWNVDVRWVEPRWSKTTGLKPACKLSKKKKQLSISLMARMKKEIKLVAFWIHDWLINCLLMPHLLQWSCVMLLFTQPAPTRSSGTFPQANGCLEKAKLFECMLSTLVLF